MECDDERRSEMGQAAKEKWQGSSEQEYGFIRPSHSNDRVRYWSSTENGGLTVGHWKWEVGRGKGEGAMVHGQSGGKEPGKEPGKGRQVDRERRNGRKRKRKESQRDRLFDFLS